MGIRAALQRRLDRATANDSGFTMIEVVVVMVIMTVVLIIFTTGVTQAFSAENKVDTASNAEGQVLIAFQRLDKEVRYATGISAPGTSSGDPVVEWLTSFTGTTTCYQLRLHTATGQLQQRTWTDGVTPVVPTGWQQLATNVTSTTPFVRVNPDSSGVFQFQRLEVAIAVTLGVNKTKTTKQSDITFTALNTTTSSATATDPCQGQRSNSW
jgi:prepilin-type N-terminal cleavage/methylation domain-containing protein